MYINTGREDIARSLETKTENEAGLGIEFKFGMFT
jgi:hypothetical protein